MAEMERPNRNTYWVVPGRLLAGEYPGAADAAEAAGRLAGYLQAGVSHFIDLTAPGELAPYAPLLRQAAAERGWVVVHERHPIADYSVPASPADMAAILDAIEAALASGGLTYVHCWGGVGRTGTVIGCYLTRTGLDGAAALARVAELYAAMSAAKRARHPHSPETAAQADYVRAWPGRDPRRR